MFTRALIAFAMVCAIPSSYSYSAGAPEAACHDMTPQHHVDPQSSNAPYKMTLSTRQLRSDGSNSVNLKIQGEDSSKTIKGLMIQARHEGKPIGKFTITSSKHTQLLNCGGPGTAVTHKKIFGNGPNSIETSWTPPSGFKGDVEFYATVALNGGIFWVNKIIEPMSVV